MKSKVRKSYVPMSQCCLLVIKRNARPRLLGIAAGATVGASMVDTEGPTPTEPLEDVGTVAIEDVGNVAIDDVGTVAIEDAGTMLSETT